MKIFNLTACLAIGETAIVEPTVRNMMKVIWCAEYWLDNGVELFINADSLKGLTITRKG